MEWGIIAALVVGILIALFLMASIWSVCICRVLFAMKNRNKARVPGKSLSGITCSVDLDCPPGYICLEGICVPE